MRGLLLVLVVLAAACTSGGDPTSTTAPTTPAGPPVVFVAIGGRETNNSDRRDLPDNWAQIVFADALPPGAVYVNLATDDATVQSAINDQLPQAIALNPTVVSVWLETADVQAGTPPATYREKLTDLVRRLRATGATTILLLTPSPASAGGGGALADSVAEVATATGATLVPLGDVSDRGGDGGQRRIADQVAAAVQAAGR